MERGVMPTRGWRRQYVSSSFSQASWRNWTSATTLQDVASNTPQDTLVRVLLDLQMTITVNTPATGGPARDWWTEINPLVAVGRVENSSDPNLNIIGQPDERITGTSMLTLANHEPAYGVANEQVAMYRLQETLDVRGMRKAVPGGQAPLMRICVQARSDISGVGPSQTWFATYWGYVRVLWETP